MSDVLASRSPSPDAAGKCDARMECTVPLDLKERAAVYWRILDFGSESEFIRFLIEREIDGGYNRAMRMARKAVGVNPGN